MLRSSGLGLLRYGLFGMWMLVMPSISNAQDKAPCPGSLAAVFGGEPSDLEARVAAIRQLSEIDRRAVNSRGNEYDAPIIAEAMLWTYNLILQNLISLNQGDKIIEALTGDSGGGRGPSLQQLLNTLKGIDFLHDPEKVFEPVVHLALARAADQNHGHDSFIPDDGTRAKEVLLSIEWLSEASKARLVRAIDRALEDFQVRAEYTQLNYTHRDLPEMSRLSVRGMRRARDKFLLDNPNRLEAGESPEAFVNRRREEFLSAVAEDAFYALYVDQLPPQAVNVLFLIQVFAAAEEAGFRSSLRVVNLAPSSFAPDKWEVRTADAKLIGEGLLRLAEDMNVQGVRFDGERLVMRYD